MPFSPLRKRLYSNGERSVQQKSAHFTKTAAKQLDPFTILPRRSREICRTAAKKTFEKAIIPGSQEATWGSFLEFSLFHRFEPKIQEGSIGHIP
jgi:hypothetical protein